MADDTSDFTLLPHRMRQVTTALQEVGFDPHAFRWEAANTAVTDAALVVTRLVHVPTGYYFQFDVLPDLTRPVVVRPERDRWQEQVNFSSVDDQIAFFADWRDLLKQQLEAGDPAAEFHGADSLFEEARTADNEVFTKAERDEFTRRLEGIRTLLLERAGDDEEAQGQTNERIDYLIGAMKRVGKRDWLFMAFGILLERGFELALPNEQIRGLLTMLARGIQQLTGG